MIDHRHRFHAIAPSVATAIAAHAPSSATSGMAPWDHALVAKHAAPAIFPHWNATERACSHPIETAA